MKKLHLFKTVLLLCALIVGSSSVWADTYTLVKNVSELSQGDVILISNGKANGSSYAMGTYSSGNNVPAKSITISEETISSLGEAQEITLESKNAGGNFTLKQSANNYFYAANSSSGKNNYLKTKNDNAVYWSITVNTTSYVAAITDETSNCNSRNKLRYNANTSNPGNPLFSCYSSADNNLFIFKKVTVDPSDPAISVSKSSLAFGDVEATGSKNMTFTITPSNLTENLTLSTNNDKYTISPTSIAYNATGAQTITVTANPTSVNNNMDGKVIISGNDFAEDTEVTLSTTVIRKSSALAYDPTSVTLTKGDDFSVPSFSKDAGIDYSAIKFTSSYGDVATVNDEGDISLGTSTGTAIIKAIFVQTDVYAAGEATCTITVNPKGVSPEPSTLGYYEKVTDTKDVTAGKYLIVYGTDAVAFDGSLATLDAGNNVESVTISDNKVSATDDIDAISFTLAVYDGGFSIQSASGKYIGRSAGSNGMDTGNSQLKNTITISSGNAVIAGTGGYQLRFNSASGDTNYRFRYYASDKQQSIQLYKYVAPIVPDDIDIYVSEAGLATYASNFDLDFTGKSVKAYIAVEDADAVKLTQINKVPKNTGILLRGAGTHTIPVATGDLDATTGNLFVRGEGEAVATDAGNGKTNYILNVVNNELGFYKANDKMVATNRAYLQTDVTPDANARIAIIFDDEGKTTGINATLMNNERMNNEVYNLNGQRVAKPTKGLYVVNGKKVVIK